MADTTTTNISLTKPEVGASTDSWGTKINTDLDTIDAIFKADGTGTSVGLNVGSGKTLKVAGSTDFASNLTFTGTGNRITGDFSNATVASRASFQSSTNNGATVIGVIPNGTSSTSAIAVYGASDPTNCLSASITTDNASMFISSGINGTGSYGPMRFYTGGSERMRIDTSGNVGIGNSSPSARITVQQATNDSTVGASFRGYTTSTGDGQRTFLTQYVDSSASYYANNQVRGATHQFYIANAEKARIDSSGNLLVGTTNSLPADNNVVGIALSPQYDGGLAQFSRTSGAAVTVNRIATDGDLVLFKQAGTTEGSISVSGTTVSYNGGHLARWSQTATPKDDSLVKGTVLSNLDEMNVYTDTEGNPVANEQLNKVKVSDIEGDSNVAGVFVNWTHDDTHNVDEINMAMTGDMIIRIAQGVTVTRGDLLMSAGDGTAKPQGDDIIRAKTVAKVTSSRVTCTYEDGSFCVPCVLMAC